MNVKEFDVSALESPYIMVNPFRAEIMRDGRSLYEIAAEQLGIGIEIMQVGYTKEGQSPVCAITFPNGENNALAKVTQKAYELAGGTEKFFRNPEAKAR